MCSFLNVFDQLSHGLLLLVLKGLNLIHRVLNESLVQVFSLLVRLKPAIYLHLDHLGNLLSDLNLLALEIVDVVTNIILSLGNLSAQVDFLLVSLQLLLLDPAIDGSQLLLKALLDAHDGLIFALELSFNN